MVRQTYGLRVGRLSRKLRKSRKRWKWRRQLRQLQTRSWVLDSRKSRKWRKPRESGVQTTGSPNNGPILGPRLNPIAGPLAPTSSKGTQNASPKAREGERKRIRLGWRGGRKRSLGRGLTVYFLFLCPEFPPFAVLWQREGVPKQGGGVLLKHHMSTPLRPQRLRVFQVSHPIVLYHPAVNLYIYNSQEFWSCIDSCLYG